MSDRDVDQATTELLAGVPTAQCRGLEASFAEIEAKLGERTDSELAALKFVAAAWAALKSRH